MKKLDQLIDLTYPVQIQRVSQTAYFDGTLIKYQDGMNPDESKQTLAMIRNRKMKVIRRQA